MIGKWKCGYEFRSSFALLLAALILLVTGTYFARIFVRTRTKDNLVVLIANTILLIGTILSYFYPGLPIPGIGKAVKIVILVVVIASLLILLFYPEIKRRINRKETKLITDPDSSTPGYKLYKGTNNGFHISFEYPDSWVEYLWQHLETTTICRYYH